MLGRVAEEGEEMRFSEWEKMGSRRETQWENKGTDSPALGETKEIRFPNSEMV